MKKTLLLLTGLLFAACAFAQKNVDLSIQLLSPAANTLYNNLMPGDSMPYTYVITNNGPDTITESDTLFILTDLNPVIVPQGYVSIIVADIQQDFLPGTSVTFQTSFREGDPYANWYIHFPVDDTVSTWAAVFGKSGNDLPFNDPGYNGSGDIWNTGFDLDDFSGNNIDTNYQIAFGSIPVESLDVSVYNNQPPVIDVWGDDLQLQAAVLPANAIQNVTWSLSPSGIAAISGGNIATLTPVANGTVWAKATSVQNPAMADSILITITNQADSLVVSTAGNIAPEIHTPSGTLQLQSAVFPSGLNQNVAWSISPIDGAAMISANGQVTAVADGHVRARATSMVNPYMSDDIVITITGQGTSISEAGQTLGIKVFPNPANDVVTVSSKTGHAALSLTLTDVKGSVLKRYSLAANALQQPFSIPMHSFAPGMYFLQLNNKDIHYTERVVKR